ncbi:MAG: hypothetical protein ABUK20_09525 [Anaerolineales bacterium]
MKRIFIYLPFILLSVAGLTSCAEVSSITALLEEDQPELETTPQAQSPAQVEVVLVDPTPTAISESQETNPPILFVSKRGTSASQDIYQINPDGSGLVRLTNSPGDASDPAWSPDRRMIAFASDQTGINQIYLLVIEDMEVRQLTDHPQGAVAPSWSPDGTQLAFTEQDPVSNAIFVLNIFEGGEPTSYTVEVSGVRSPAWTPQGDVLAFSAHSEDPLGERDIFSFDIDSKTLVNLTNHPGNDDRPAWSPDSGRIIFQSDRDGDENIYIMQADGRLQTPLTDDPASDLEPDWARDGRTVVFSSDREGKYDLHLMTESGADERALAVSTTDDRQAHWFVQPPLISDELAVAVGISPPPYNLSVISTSGAQKTEVLKSDESDDTMPDWSPNGKKLVFASNLFGNYDIYVLEVETNEIADQLTTHPGADMHPAWSPQGGEIAFESKRDDGDWDIWVIKEDGSELRNLTADLNSNEGNPAWSPDGKQIVFSSDRDGDFDIFVMSAEGSGETLQLSDLPGDEYHPTWSPDGEEIVFRSTNSDSGQRQLFIMKSDGSALSQLIVSQANDDSPTWSPDSRWVVFASDRANTGNRNQPGKFDVFLYDTWTGEIFQVTQGDKDVRYPAWRPSKTNGTQ